MEQERSEIMEFPRGASIPLVTQSFHRKNPTLQVIKATYMSTDGLTGRRFYKIQYKRLGNFKPKYSLKSPHGDKGSIESDKELDRMSKSIKEMFKDQD